MSLLFYVIFKEDLFANPRMGSFLLLAVTKDAIFATTGCSGQYLSLLFGLHHSHKPNLCSP